MRFVIQGPVADAVAAWRLVADTDHLNRLGGNPPLTMEMVADEDGFAELRGTMLGPVGIRHEFQEVDHRWVQGREFRQERDIQGPLLRHTLYQATLTPEGDGMRPQISLEVQAANPIIHPGLSAAMRGVRKAWQARLDALPAPGQAPTVETLRLLDHGAEASLRRWRERGASDVMVSRVRRLFQSGRAWELQGLRAFVLADRWHQPRQRVLQAFVEGTAAGVFEMRWSVRCPRCRASVTQTDSLSGLSEHAGCPSCRIDFDVDLQDTVEVLFAAPPGVAPRQDERFCTLYPVRRMDVVALALLLPGVQRGVDVDLDAGEWTLVADGDMADVPLHIGAEGPDRVEWTPGAGTLRAGAGTVHLDLRNTGTRRVRLSLTRSQWDVPAVTAAEMATLPAYRGIFGPQVLAPGVRVGVRMVAVLFTDLTDSTAFYASEGDAAAFAFVRDHFDVLDQVIQGHGGVRVKTMGDALMAAFHDPRRAAEAAIEMQAAYRRFLRGWSLEALPRLRVGLHAGTALGVHTDAAGLDYFGGTVNLAARAVSRAAGDEVVWTRAVQEVAGVPELVAAAGLEASSFAASLKGLSQPVSLYRVR